MADILNLSKKQLDTLREIVNIGAGNAATALSQLLNKRVDMSVPKINIMPLTDVPEMLGDSERRVVGIYFKLYGSAAGSILFLMPLESANYLIKLLLQKEHSDPQSIFEEIFEASTIMEIGNIVTGSYLTAICTMADISLIPSVPYLAVDMFGAILSSILFQLGTIGEHALILDTMFHVENENLKSNFLLIPDPGSLDVLLKSIEVKYGA